MNLGLGFIAILPNKRVEGLFLNLLSKRKENYLMVMRISPTYNEPPSIFLCTTKDGVILHNDDAKETMDFEGARYITLKSHNDEFLELWENAGLDPIAIQSSTQLRGMKHE